MHGLANRMRAFCSAHAFARQAGHRLLLIWEPDVHSRTAFEDLFELPAEWEDEERASATHRALPHRVLSLQWHC